VSRIAAVTGQDLKLLERHVSRQVRDFLEYRGWRAIRMQRTVIPGSFQTGEKGMADYLFVRYLPEVKPGCSLTLWVETKRPGGPLRKHQPEWHAEERLRGAQVWVVDDFDLFARNYERVWGWLHHGGARGQLEFSL